MKRKNKLVQIVITSIGILLLSFIFARTCSASVKEEDIIAKMKLVAKNTSLELYVNEDDTSIAVKVLESGDIWFSNPIDIESDSLATPYNKQLLQSQFSLKYHNKSVQVSEMDNYNDSIKHGQFIIENIADGIKITYTLGEAVSKIILPTVISEERYFHFYNQMDEAGQKQVKRNYSFLSLDTMKESEKEEYLTTYPGLKNHNIYILKSGTKDYKQEELMGYFSSVGYSLEDMNADMLDNGYEANENKPYFIVPLSYQLDGDNLLVSIVPNDIEYNTEDYYLVDIDLLEYFGAAGVNESGYMFVPDGSGALIYLNNGKITKSSYTSSVYGQDKTNNMMINKKSEIAENLTIKLPVFGIQYDKKALFAIIEDGEAFADINAEISGRVNSYNNVYAGFTYLQNGGISLGDIVGSNSFQMYADKPYSGVYRLRYAFLTKEDANYSGMANYYRNYLISRNKLLKNEVKSELPFFLEFIGAIDKTKSFLGIKYQAVEALTTYKQAETIVRKLLDEGLSNIKIRYTGWLNGGLGSKAPTKVSPVSKLNKGGLNIKEFLYAMNQLDIPVYTDVDFQYVYKDTLFDGFTQNSLSPRYFDKSIVKTGRYLIPNGIMFSKNIKLISPFFLNSVVDRFTNKASKYELNGISVATLARDVYSDFMTDNVTNRQKAVEYNRSAMEKLASQYKVMGVNGNSYSFASVSDMIEVPMDSNSFYIVDESIPFYQMVIRGYIEFTGSPLNMANDFKEELLKSVETGAGLYFKWIYANNSSVKETDYDSLYSVNYEHWLKEAVSTYEKVNQVFHKLQGQTIINHQKIESEVYKVTYEDGTEIVVNYNKDSIIYAGKTIEGKGFTIVKEGW